MNVFVVLTHAMGGWQLAGVHRTEDEANERLATLAFGLKPYVEQVVVVGEQPDLNGVYSAEYYDADGDVHHYQGIFGSFEAAKKAAGPRGQALSRAL